MLGDAPEDERIGVSSPCAGPLCLRQAVRSAPLCSSAGLIPPSLHEPCAAAEGGNHRIIEWFVSEETSKDHLVQPSRHGQGHLSLNQVAQSPIQLDLECCRGWGIYHLSGQPVPVSHHPHSKEFLPYV